MTTPRVGVSIACASVLVSAPRMVLAILAADRVYPSRAVEAALLVLSAVGAVAVLGWGNLYLVHVIASTERRRALLSCFAVLQLLAMLALLLPLVLSGMEARPLHQVLETQQLRVAWSIVTIAAPELLAVACVIAAATLGGTAAAPARVRGERSGGIVTLGLYQDAIAPARPSPGTSPRRSRVVQSADPNSATVCRQGCGASFTSARAERAHLRFCSRSPARASA